MLLDLKVIASVTRRPQTMESAEAVLFDPNAITRIIKAHAVRLGVPCSRILKEARIAESTFSSWYHARVYPSTQSLKQVSHAIKNLEAHKTKAANPCD